MIRAVLRKFLSLCIVLVLTLIVAVVANAETKTFAEKSLPLTFEQNNGQVPKQYRYMARRNGVESLYSTEGTDFFVPQSGNSVAQVQVRWINTNPRLLLQGEERLPGYSNYLLGSNEAKWLRNVPQFSGVRYEQIYSGIDLFFHGNGEDIEHDFLISAGSDVSQIQFQLNKPAKITAEGDLAIQLDQAMFRLRKPIAYQQFGPIRKNVTAEFMLTKTGVVKFKVGSYDHTRSLVIDPAFVFSTYLAGTGADQITGLTTDAAGNVYATGYTGSVDFPIQNGEQTTCASCAISEGPDAFVSKLDPTGGWPSLSPILRRLG